MQRKNLAQDPEACVLTRSEVWLTRKELAARWKVPSSTLAQWAVGKRGPQYAVFGRHVRYRLADIIAWEDQAVTGWRDMNAGSSGAADRPTSERETPPEAKTPTPSRGRASDE